MTYAKCKQLAKVFKTQDAYNSLCTGSEGRLYKFKLQLILRNSQIVRSVKHIAPNYTLHVYLRSVHDNYFLFLVVIHFEQQNIRDKEFIIETNIRKKNDAYKSKVMLLQGQIT